MKTKLRIAIWLVTLVVFTFGMSITGINLGIIERVVGMVFFSIFYWVVTVKTITL